LNRYNQGELFGHGNTDEADNFDDGTMANMDGESTIDNNIEPDTTLGVSRQRDKMENKTFLSQSLHGSRRDLLSLAQNALFLVSEFGRPTLYSSL